LRDRQLRYRTHKGRYRTYYCERSLTNLLSFFLIRPAVRDQLNSLLSVCCMLQVHGFGGNADHFRKNTGVLGHTGPTYAIDLLGYGMSSKPGKIFYSVC
jgi:pimeloyl-ACP methyl ester carboxylesterase